MTCRKLAFQRLSRSEAIALSARSGSRGALICDDTLLGAGSVRLSMAHGKLDWASLDACLSLTWGADRFELHCPAKLPKLILRAFDAALEVETMPMDLAALLLEAALLPAITRLEQATGRDITLTSMTTTDIGAIPDGVVLLLENDGQRWQLLLSAQGGPLTALLRFWPVIPRAMPRFHLPAALRIGATRLPRVVFMSLRLGDAVLLQIGDGKCGMLVVAETWTAIVQQDAPVWRLVETPKPAAETARTEWTMQTIDAADGAEESEPISNPDQLPVHLTFDVGRLEVTLAELRRLGPGSVVELGRSIAEPVRISAQGRPVGQGELVDIEGVIGVKVIRLFDYE
jgi:type III secretion protein Q